MNGFPICLGFVAVSNFQAQNPSVTLANMADCSSPYNLSALFPGNIDDNSANDIDDIHNQNQLSHLLGLEVLASCQAEGAT
jgi:hypothetical protein